MKHTDQQKNISVCALVPYAPGTTPSQRFRIEQWMDYLRDREGITVELLSFADHELMALLREPGRIGAKAMASLAAYVRAAMRVAGAIRYDAVMVHRTIALAGPALLERLLKATGKPVIYEFDDAIFLLHTSEVNRRFGWMKFPQKTATICGLSSHVVVGNEWLAEYARQFNDQVTIIPTSIETDRYRTFHKNGAGDHNGNGRRVVIGWTGSSTSQTYLEWFAPVLGEFMKRRDVELRVISNREPEMQDVPYVWREWRPETEIEEISRFDIGIMPMPEDQWSRGKCALKALQCMAAGTPVVCSAIGANLEVISHGENGILADTPEEWIQNLEKLVDDPALRFRLGEAGRQTVEDRYSTERCARMFAEVVRKTLKRHYGEEER
ncbi:MAG: glycosyltransferase family 4 protein [Blastocatellales bacterium]